MPQINMQTTSYISHEAIISWIEKYYPEDKQKIFDQILDEQNKLIEKKKG